MDLNLKVNYFTDSDTALVFYPNCTETSLAHLFFGVYLFLTVLISVLVFDYTWILFLLLPIGLLSLFLYYRGETKVIVDKEKKAVFVNKPFSEKFIANLSEVSHIQYDYIATADAGYYTCYFKSDPYGEGLRLTPDFLERDKEESKKIQELYSVAVPVFQQLISEESSQEPIREKTLSDIRLFTEVQEGVYLYKYLDCVSCFIAGILAGLLIIVPFFFENYSLFLLLIIPLLLFTRKSSVVVDRNNKKIHTRMLWGIDRHACSYEDIDAMSIERYSNRHDQYMASDVFVVLKNGTAYVVFHRMLFERNTARLLKEFEFLIKE